MKSFGSSLQIYDSYASNYQKSYGFLSIRDFEHFDSRYSRPA